MIGYNFNNTFHSSTALRNCYSRAAPYEMLVFLLIKVSHWMTIIDIRMFYKLKSAFIFISIIG